MPRTEQVFSIFLASPSDVTDERACVSEVVEAWNRAWSRNLGIRLELFRWEDDAYPSIGEDPQDVVNQQLPEDWDLFIGIMWARFGTRTGRAGSGTEEEFRRALVRHRSNPNGSQISFYFKDAPIPPSKINPEQLAQVQRFKESMSAEGLLTWDFPDIDQFEKLVGLHITRHVQEWRTQPSAPIQAAAQPNPVPAKSEVVGTTETPLTPSEEEGYLDLLESLTTKGHDLNAVLERISAAQDSLTQQNIRGTAEINALREDPATFSPTKAKATIARVAEEMLRCSHSIEGELPALRAAIDESLGAVVRLSTLSMDLYPEQRESTYASVVSLLSHLQSARASMEGFRQSSAELPRMTTQLNAAKRRLLAALDSLIAEFKKGERLLEEGSAIVSPDP